MRLRRELADDGKQAFDASGSGESARPRDEQKSSESRACTAVTLFVLTCLEFEGIGGANAHLANWRPDEDESGSPCF
ncbi:uncharacterized protein SCHCODRAFT_02626732 [Schizophyllum commune H4-8]|uniref:uncharacterized protein n=1 Tax=Schizophyllum commune (strain H4-8 / FGSC 9210) TaxID=578458 RepID=UPI00215F9C51|nr:uncharacterized protein SCHCODRAFT_02626732 [Schizophyllum commune H4-8]KAI5892648.1 hypothetical protein SCHCODRAFT_02626732 [Schizophyllum commune H4-8]